MSSSPDLVTTDERLATELVSAVTHLRRVLRRRIRREWPYEPLARNQIDLLRLVSERPGVGVAEAAAFLALAPNTVSTLVNELRGMALLERSSDDVDRRVARLTLSEAGRTRLAAWRDRRGELLSTALAKLSGKDRAALAGSLPALARLIAVLEAQQP
jgi:DNA-binding MarR family transcriptional regulator